MKNVIYAYKKKSSNKIVKALGERLAMNAPIQGSAADILKIAMIRIDEELTNRKLKSKMVFQVHDELVFDVAIDEAEIVKEIVIEEMEYAVKLSVPLDVECGFGNNWMEIK